MLTHPVCDEGMPPDPMSLVKSHLRSLYQYVNSLSVCAITNASTAATQGLRSRESLSSHLIVQNVYLSGSISRYII